MILLTHDTPILLCVAPSDFRKGIDGFVAVCRLELSLDPRCGTVFMFINRARTMIRALDLRWHRVLDHDKTSVPWPVSELANGRVCD